MTAPRMYVRACGQGHELVAIVTPETLHAKAERALTLAEANGNAAVAAVGSGRLSAYDTLRARAHRLFDAAHRYAAQAREAIAREIAAPVLIQCAQCGKDTNAADLVPQDDDEDICRQCHSDNVEEGNRLIEEDWANYNAIVREGLGL